MTAASEPARVTVVLLAIIYDALPSARRLALFAPGVAWWARGPRVESSPVEVGSAQHRALVGAVEKSATRIYVESDVGARRCAWCGCTDNFRCVGGCSWILPERCSACRDRREPEPRHRLAPGSPTPGALAAAAKRGRS